MRNKLKMEEYMSIFEENNISKEVSALITSIDTEWNQLVELRYDWSITLLIGKMKDILSVIIYFVIDWVVKCL